MPDGQTDRWMAGHISEPFRMAQAAVLPFELLSQEGSRDGSSRGQGDGDEAWKPSQQWGWGVVNRVQLCSTASLSDCALSLQSTLMASSNRLQLPEQKGRGMRLQGHKYQQKQLACLGPHSGEPWPSPATRHAHAASRVPGGGHARADGFWVGPGAGDARGGGKLPTPLCKCTMVHSTWSRSPAQSLWSWRGNPGLPMSRGLLAAKQPRGRG